MLHVSLYYKELGLLPPGIDTSSQFEAVPSDIAVDCAPEIVGFILHNQSLKLKVTNSQSLPVVINGVMGLVNSSPSQLIH